MPEAVISVLASHRPDVLHATLRSIAAANPYDGDALYVATLDGEGHPQRERCLDLIRNGPVRFDHVQVLSPRRHCNGAVKAAMDFGFEQAEFFIHIEDDTPVCYDFFDWMRFALKAHRTNERVFAVSAFNWGRVPSNGPIPPQVPEFRTFEEAKRNQYAYGYWTWYTCWAFGLWRDRYLFFRDRWPPHGAESWDTAIWKQVMEQQNADTGRYVQSVVPLVSRSYNLGMYDGAHHPKGEDGTKFWALYNTCKWYSDWFAPEEQKRWLKVANRMHVDGFPSGWFTHGEGRYYQKAIEERPNGVYVELGVWLGRSLKFAMHQVAKTGGQMVAVDLWEPSTLDLPADHPDRMEDVFEQFKLNLLEPDFAVLGAKDIRIIQENSATAARHFQNESVDVVFIDAQHDKESTLKDIKAWWPKLKNGGIMLGHDWHILWPGVVAAVYDCFGLPDATSENIWRVVKKPDRMKAR